MTRFWYELHITNGKQTRDTFRFETDLTAALPPGSKIYPRGQFSHEQNLSGLVISGIYHELPIPDEHSDNPYIREGRVIMAIQNGKGEQYLRASNYKALEKYLKAQGWKSRTEHNYRI